ncbi:MAG: preprotein translocase subunit SecG [Chloroflexi bacterium]|nr:preprotein translocase subunit SecG [Chloroflexota bacterium]|tara:strand:+ start:40 stop:276 length:237 start_codon:yes stop_codon:yes gene_type:complete
MEETTSLLKPILNIIQITSAIILVTIILLQVRGQGGGLFGASDGSFRTRRGIERTLFQATIVLSVFFIVISIISAKYL